MYDYLFKYRYGNSLLILCLTILITFSGCKDSITDPPPEEKPPGYQEDIPWPSLAESPWPMYRCDPQNTGRSRYSGALSGEVDWMIDTIFNHTGAAVGPDSTIYFVNSTGNTGLYAVNPNGNIKWYFPFPLSTTSDVPSPIIASDGTIYTGMINFYAINKDGSLKWSIDNVFIRCTGNTIGKDGTLYLFSGKDGGTIYSVSAEGSINWTFSIVSNYGDFSTLALSPDSKTLYIIGEPGHYLAAIDLITVSLKWKALNNIVNNPTVDSQGNIYVTTEDSSERWVNYTVYSLNTDGSIRWKYQTEDYSMHDISIDRNGNIYFNSDTLYSLSYDGNLRWKKSFPNIHSDSPVSVDKNNQIYCFKQEGNSLRGFCYDSSGNTIWEHSYPDGLIGYSPVIGFNYTIFPTYHDQYIIKIK